MRRRAVAKRVNCLPFALQTASARVRRRLWLSRRRRNLSIHLPDVPSAVQASHWAPRQSPCLWQRWPADTLAAALICLKITHGVAPQTGDAKLPQSQTPCRRRAPMAQEVIVNRLVCTVTRLAPRGWLRLSPQLLKVPQRRGEAAARSCPGHAAFCRLKGGIPVGCV